jgi:hypothetical protein
MNGYNRLPKKIIPAKPACLAGRFIRKVRIIPLPTRNRFSVQCYPFWALAKFRKMKLKKQGL